MTPFCNVVTGPDAPGGDSLRGMKATLITERILLRPWRDSDRKPFARINADRQVMEFMPALLSQEESDRLVNRIHVHFEKHGFGLFAAELRDNGIFLGFIGLSVPGFDAPFMPAVEIGWRLASELWGQGLATEAAREVLRFAFQELGLMQVVSFTVPENARSRRVMEKLGMTHDADDDFDHPLLPEGHARRRHVLYRLKREDWSPAE